MYQVYDVSRFPIFLFSYSERIAGYGPAIARPITMVAAIRNFFLVDVNVLSSVFTTRTLLHFVRVCSELIDRPS